MAQQNTGTDNVNQSNAAKGHPIFRTAAASIAAALVIIFIVIAAGFRFTPSAAVHEFWQNGVVIHTDEYDFFSDADENDADPESAYIDSFIAVKRYGILYRKAEPDIFVLHSDAGEIEGYLFCFYGRDKVYNFIHYARDSVDRGSGYDEAVLRHFTDSITIDGKPTELYLHSYFVTDSQSKAPIGSFELDGVAVHTEKLVQDDD